MSLCLSSAQVSNHCIQNNLGFYLMRATWKSSIISRPFTNVSVHRLYEKNLYVCCLFYNNVLCNIENNTHIIFKKHQIGCFHTSRLMQCFSSSLHRPADSCFGSETQQLCSSELHDTTAGLLDQTRPDRSHRGQTPQPPKCEIFPGEI